MRSHVAPGARALRSSRWRSPAHSSFSQSIATALDRVDAPASTPDHPLVASGSAPEGAIVADLPAGTLQVDLPATELQGVLEEGTAVFAGDDGAALSAQTLDDGVRLLVTIPDETAPETYDFALAGDVAALTDPDEDGALGVVDADGQLIAAVEAPWAVDANGQHVPTEFVIEGATLQQVVRHRGGDYAYPITADPSILFFVKCGAQIARFIAENGGPGKILKGGVAGAKTFVKLLKRQGSKKNAVKYLVYELSGAKGIADLVDKCYPT
ncbi:hypothetical protein F9L07_11710 [Pimelobacter simplex]|uniref:Uncharacterized protein n=1 Tax=Nocardioides simplex TaxID=2045 RepID=A0A7J5E2D8_NOCSI|nr:hypothetical protein [Pimelobacter simplex]KAB2812431.1 hypothetical protein F9L07_11710 [Pimelobacter simplex]